MVGAAHAGWKGALTGVLEATIAAMEKLGADARAHPRRDRAADPPAELRGRAGIRRPLHGGDERERPLLRAGGARRPRDVRPAGLHRVAARTRRNRRVEDLGLCTYADPARFFSYRRTTHRGEPDYGRHINAIALDEIRQLDRPAVWRYPNRCRRRRGTWRHDRPRRIRRGVSGWSGDFSARVARFVGRGIVAALLAACAAGCSETTSSNVALTSGAFRPDHRVRIDRRPAGRRVQPAGRQHLQPRRRRASVAIASREGAANYRVRGYLAAQVDPRPHAYLLGRGTSTTTTKLRTLRIAGEEPAAARGADPWSVADEAMLRRIARASMERLAAFLAIPDRRPGRPPPIADASEPGQRKPPRPLGAGAQRRPKARPFSLGR